jgi:hypothetical protein
MMAQNCDGEQVKGDAAGNTPRESLLFRGNFSHEPTTTIAPLSSLRLIEAEGYGVVVSRRDDFLLVGGGF